MTVLIELSGRVSPGQPVSKGITSRHKRRHVLKLPEILVFNIQDSKMESLDAQKTHGACSG